MDCAETKSKVVFKKTTHGPFTRTDGLPVGQNGNGLKTDKNGNRTEIKREWERNGITRPVVWMGDGNFFLTPTVYSRSVTNQ